tara:strand:- start:1956 stop:2624 length:669 start_codon:yes stop_codon:yes gene_type:complete
MSLLLSFLITISSYNIAQYYWDISIADVFPQLKADMEIEASTGMELKNPQNGVSIYILNGSKISIKSTLDLFENYKFEYYDHSNGLLYISRDQKIMYAPINKIKWIKIVDDRKNDTTKAILPIGGFLTGGAIGAAVGIGAGVASCSSGKTVNPAVIILAPFGTAAVGALIGGTAGLTGTKKGDSYNYSTGKIYLSGKKAWDIKPVDADEIINSYIKSTKPID